MRKPTILIADNDADYRRSLSALMSQAGYQTEEAGSVAEARGILAAVDIDLALIDLRLTDDSPSDFSGLAVVEALRPRDSGTLWVLLTAFDGVPVRALQELSPYIRRREETWLWPKLSSGEDLLRLVQALLSPTILHLSDLHFGPRGSYEPTLEKLCLDVRDLRAEFGVRPTVVVVTGDIAHQSLRGTYGPARHFLLALASKIGVPSERLVLVPGNHDVDRTAAREECRNLAARGAAAQDLETGALLARFKRYHQFHNSFYQHLRRRLGSRRLFDIVDLHEWGMLMVAFNSCLGERPDPEDYVSGWLSRGEIGSEQLRAAISELRETRDRLHRQGHLRPLLYVAAFHHHCPLSANPAGDEGYLRDFEQLQASFASAHLAPLAILHGHAHRTFPYAAVQLGAEPVLVFATGSAGLGAQQRTTQYTIIQFRIAPRWQSRLFLRRYEPTAKRPDDVTEGAWVADHQSIRTADINGIVHFPLQFPAAT